MWHSKKFINKLKIKNGIVQPYFLLNVGYFTLINAVDKFVYFNDVYNILEENE